MFASCSGKEGFSPEVISGLQSVWLMRFIIFIGWRSFSRLFLWMRDQSQMDLTTFLWEGPPNSLLVLVFFHHMVVDVPRIHCHFVLNESAWRNPYFCCFLFVCFFTNFIIVSFKFVKISSVLPPQTPSSAFFLANICLLFLHLNWS